MRRPPRHYEHADQRKKDDRAPQNAADANARFQILHVYDRPSKFTSILHISTHPDNVPPTPHINSAEENH
jgi:hypothetical protein